ncbi:10839_t:CDS:2 [Racocetra persica]|uniref:10839_t:CDS:1 n=1 Tax=Racocetra persica TaxID=160502 RepID=A0ACA9LV74_9GLOM|nr:10839_t:CDS:2 [Racocetra persica]
MLHREANSTLLELFPEQKAKLREIIRRYPLEIHYNLNDNNNQELDEELSSEESSSNEESESEESENEESENEESEIKESESDKLEKEIRTSSSKTLYT